MREEAGKAYEQLSEATKEKYDELTPKQAQDILEDARRGHPEEIDVVEDHVDYVHCENNGESLKCDFGSGMKEVDAFHFKNTDTDGYVNGTFELVTDEIEARYKSGRGVCYFGHEEGTEGRYISCDERD